MGKWVDCLCIAAGISAAVWTGCAGEHPLEPVDDQASYARAGKPAAAPTYRTEVLVTVVQNGASAGGLEVSFSRSISGRPTDYKWIGTTGENGEAIVEIAVDPSGPFRTTGATGYYLARASEQDEIAGVWESIPLNDGKRTRLILEVGQPFRVSVVEPVPVEPASGSQNRPGKAGGNFKGHTSSALHSYF